jgi:hypothetical protein
VETFDPHWFFSFNAAGSYLERGPGLPVESEDKPFFTFLVDDPSYHAYWLDFLRRPAVRTSVTNPFARAQAAELGIDPMRVFEIGLAGRPLPRVRPDAREIDVLFSGTLFDPDEIRAGIRTELSPAMFQLWDTFCEMWLADLTRPSHEVLRCLLRERGLDSGNGARDTSVDNLFLGIGNRYVRNKSRLDVLRHFAHLPLVVHGRGWQKHFAGSRFQFRPPIAYNRNVEETARAKFVLNVQPLSLYGVGERAYNATLNGAVLVNTRNRLLPKTFEPGRDYLSFDLDAASMQATAARVEQLLACEAERAEMAERARAIALRQHTWAARARRVLEIMSGPAGSSLPAPVATL